MTHEPKKYKPRCNSAACLGPIYCISAVETKSLSSLERDDADQQEQFHKNIQKCFFTMTKWFWTTTLSPAHRLSKQRGYWRGSSCGNLNFYDSSSRSSSGSCRWTRGSLRLQLNESSWRKALKATAEQPETNMPPSGVSPSLPLQHGTKMQTALNSAACLGLILCIGA